MLAQGRAVQILPQAQGEGMTSDFPSVNGLKMQKKYGGGTSLVVPWLRLQAPSSGGAWVQSLVRELDPTCCN